MGATSKCVVFTTILVALAQIAAAGEPFNLTDPLAGDSATKGPQNRTVGGGTSQSKITNKNQKPTISLAPGEQHLLEEHAKFITCLAWDHFRQAAWVGTEADGIYEYQLSAAAGKQWTHFTTSNGLADNTCDAIAVDQQDRVWCGSDRHGVDIYVSRSKGWRRYDVLPLPGDIADGEAPPPAHADLRNPKPATSRPATGSAPAACGPLGSHPFAIRLDPYTGDIYDLDEAGISTYSPQHHTWRYVTAANGLPTNQLNDVAFLPDGRLILATQCQGLLIGTPLPVDRGPRTPQGVALPDEFRNSYRWQHIAGPLHTPDVARGAGIPTNLTNMLYTPDHEHQDIYLATDSGLALSRNGGQTWRFEQGWDYAARVAGLKHPPEGFRRPPATALRYLLSGEHVTCVTQDAGGDTYLGFWRSGYMVSSQDGRHVYRTADESRFAKSDDNNGSDYVSCILPLPNGQVLIGRYGSGLFELDPAKLDPWFARGEGEGRSLQTGVSTRPTGPPATQASRDKVPAAVDFPTPAPVPTLDQIVALRNSLMQIPPDHATSPLIIPLDDDWRTRGNWIDRYGCMYARLFAQNGNADQIAGYTDFFFTSAPSAWVDPHWRAAEYGRYWLVGRQRNSNDPRTLQDLLDGGRTCANVDDHGETYANTIDGPNLYWTVMVPAGQYILSLYFENDDGHVGLSNRQRDYMVKVIDTPMSLRDFSRIGDPVDKAGRLYQPADAVDHCQPVAASRVENFWPGVYKRFFVRVSAAAELQGTPRAIITVCVRRNASFDTVLQGAFLDAVGRYPWYYATKQGQERMALP